MRRPYAAHKRPFTLKEQDPVYVIGQHDGYIHCREREMLTDALPASGNDLSRRRNLTSPSTTSPRMQFLRQVLSPLGTYNCPVYRNQPHGSLGDRNAYADLASFQHTRRSVAQRIDTFNATTTCAEVTCLYNDANWWIEDLIANPQQLDSLAADTAGPPDYFL